MNIRTLCTHMWNHKGHIVLHQVVLYNSNMAIPKSSYTDHAWSLSHLLWHHISFAVDRTKLNNWRIYMRFKAFTVVKVWFFGFWYLIVLEIFTNIWEELDASIFGKFLQNVGSGLQHWIVSEPRKSQSNCKNLPFIFVHCSVQHFYELKKRILYELVSSSTRNMKMKATVVRLWKEKNGSKVFLPHSIHGCLSMWVAWREESNFLLIWELMFWYADL